MLYTRGMHVSSPKYLLREVNDVKYGVASSEKNRLTEKRRAFKKGRCLVPVSADEP